MAPDNGQAGKPTLIHLSDSSSQIVLWLAEELGIDYEIRKFVRPRDKPTEELKATHPQGRAPQLITPDGRVITQLSAVVLHLIRTYDTDHRFHDPSTDDPVREEQLVCIAITDLLGTAGMKNMWDILVARSPFFVRPIFSQTKKIVNGIRLEPDLKAAMGVLEGELQGREWFAGPGGGPSRADIILKFVLDCLIQPGFLALDGYPAVSAWYSKCVERDAWKRSLAKGNGYNLVWS